MCKKVLKAVLAAVLMCASYYGFFVLEAEQFAWIRLILFIQGVVWMAVAYEWGMDCVDESERIPLFPIVEDDFNPDTYDNEL